MRGIIESTLALVVDGGVTHLGVATDTVIESFRNDLFDGYKTGEGIEPALWAQFPLAERAFAAIGVPVWGMIEFEADDALASATEKWRAQVEQVVILSPDKDLMQLVRGEQVVTYNRRESKRYAEDDVREKFGVWPHSIPDYLALVGDTADGVPGLPGWGAKSSSIVLFEYDHLESIPDDVEEWTVKPRGAAKLAATLAERREEAMLYRTLTTLRTDAPIPQTLDEMEWQGVDMDLLGPLCAELGFESMLERDLPTR